MGAKYFGAVVSRREDPALVTGQGCFVDDITLPGMLHAAVLRSSYAHARVLSVRKERALSLSGVIAVFMFDDLRRCLKPLPVLAIPPPGLKARVAIRVKEVPHYPLAHDVVRYAGEPIALIVAESSYIAEDALGAIDVEYEPLPAVTDARSGAEGGAPVLHAGLDDNVAVSFTGRTGDAERVFAAAPVVVREQLRVQRHAGMPLEPRGVIAAWERRSGTLTTWNSTQLPHFVQQEVAAALEVPAHKVRVITPDVGGGFGTKACPYAEDVLIPLAARELGRPVKWVESRREHMMAAAHSRDQLQEVELAATRDGILLGVRGRIWLDLGAYNPGGFILAYNTLTHLLGPYRVRNVEVAFIGVLTNKTPVAPYRGAGRPEAAFAMDRLVDRLAGEVGVDPIEVRRRNLIRPDEMPYDTGLVYRDGHPLVYDSGDYPSLLTKALEAVGYERFRQEQAEFRSRGVYRGIGVSMYVEGTALGPYESAIVKLDRSGRAIVATGACSQGQGHETVFAQIAADALGVPLDWVTVIGGDTDRVGFGVGTFVSRSAVMAGNAIATASLQVREKVLKAASRLLEAAPQDLEMVDGGVFVRGARSSALSLAHIVQMSLPTYAATGEPPFEASVYHHVPTVTYASGAHVAEVEVDPETGRVKLLRYLVAHDCGRVINPMIVEGQMHGGVAQGVGGALLEELVYDREGQLLSGTFMEYALPTATDLPSIETLHLESPSPRNPLGVKGAGEGGAIAPPAAIANAVEDALARFGVRIRGTPVTSAEIVRQVLETTRRGSSSGVTRR